MSTEKPAMNTIDHNLKLWGDFGWDRKGEHWSDGWGGPDAQWFFSIYPRIARHLPCENMVEIATGYGRWTKYLVQHCQSYTGFDLVEKCSDYCRETYGGPNRSFVTNDGLHLTGIGDHSIDFVYSMDSLVHVDWSTLSSYLAEIIRVLKPAGTAVIHHSNAAAVAGFNELDPPNRRSFRAADVSGEKVKAEIESLGGGVYAQEMVDWGGSGPDALIDCFTTIVAHSVETRIVENPKFMADRREILALSELYHPSS